MMPMIVNGCPSSCTVLPTTPSGSAPRTQRPRLDNSNAIESAVPKARPPCGGDGRGWWKRAAIDPWPHRPPTGSRTRPCAPMRSKTSEAAARRSSTSLRHVHRHRRGRGRSCPTCTRREGARKGPVAEEDGPHHAVEGYSRCWRRCRARRCDKGEAGRPPQVVRRSEDRTTSAWRYFVAQRRATGINTGCAPGPATRWRAASRRAGREGHKGHGVVGVKGPKQQALGRLHRRIVERPKRVRELPAPRRCPNAHRRARRSP